MRRRTRIFRGTPRGARPTRNNVPHRYLNSTSPQGRTSACTPRMEKAPSPATPLHPHLQQYSSPLCLAPHLASVFPPSACCRPPWPGVPCQPPRQLPPGRQTCLPRQCRCAARAGHHPHLAGLDVQRPTRGQYPLPSQLNACRPLRLQRHSLLPAGTIPTVLLLRRRPATKIQRAEAAR